MDLLDFSEVVLFIFFFHALIIIVRHADTVSVTKVLLLVTHELIKDIHNSWLYCFTNPLELGTRVSLSHRQPNSADDATMRKRNTCPKFKRISETI